MEAQSTGTGRQRTAECSTSAMFMGRLQAASVSGNRGFAFHRWQSGSDYSGRVVAEAGTPELAVARRYPSADGFLRGSSQIRAELRCLLTQTSGEKPLRNAKYACLCATCCLLPVAGAQRAQLCDSRHPITPETQGYARPAPARHLSPDPAGRKAEHCRSGYGLITAAPGATRRHLSPGFFR